MFIKLYLTNGQTVSAFVDEATVEYLNEVIIEEGCYDDESEITDYDYVDYANLMSGEFVFIFDKKYDLEKDVESFEVDRYAMESEEDKEKRMAKYRTVSQDAMDYALDFFHGSISKVFENERDVNPDSLPILFTTEDDRSRTLLLRGKLRAAETAAYFRRYSLPDCACGHQTAHNHYDERRASVTC